jgi:glycosyltransferase involved in cell wall biosynthesis
VKPLKVALVVKHSSQSVRERECRNMGYWSYPVPEFEWTHFDGFGPASELNEFDVVIQEDAGPKRYSGLRAPLVYVAIDSTLSEDHLNSRLPRAGNADLILVDHGPLEPFYQLNKPVMRWNYCVNDNLMRDYGEPKDIDVSFLCGGRNSEERKELRGILSHFCEEAGLTFASGVLHPTEYARAMARSKIVVNWPRHPMNRPHRVFDAMACGACLVTGPLPKVEGDNIKGGCIDFAEVENIDDVPDIIEHVFEDNEWLEIANSGHQTVLQHHTWAIRAKQLRAILESELGI